METKNISFLPTHLLSLASLTEEELEKELAQMDEVSTVSELDAQDEADRNRLAQMLKEKRRRESFLKSSSLSAQNSASISCRGVDEVADEFQEKESFLGKNPDSLENLPPLPLQFIRVKPKLQRPSSFSLQLFPKEGSRAALQDEIRAIESFDRIRQVSFETIAQNFQAVNAYSTRVAEAHKAQVEALHESAKRLESSSVWSILRTVIEAIVAATILVVGAVLLATPAHTLLGVCMIGFGLLSIGNLIMRETGAWLFLAEKMSGGNSQTAKILSLFFSGAIALGCAILAPYLLAMGITQMGFSLVRDLPILLEMTLALVEGITTIGSGVAEARLNLNQAQLARLGKLLSMHRFFSKAMSQLLDTLLKEANLSAELAQSIVRVSLRTRKKVTQKV